MIRNALRIAALIAGLVLIVGPLWWLIDLNFSVHIKSVPLKYRRDFSDRLISFILMLFAIYGSVLVGIAVHWVRAKRSGQSSFPSDVFKAGMLGMLVVCIAFFAGVSLYGLVKYASIEKAVGNLWGVVVIIWGILSALVSAGIALLFYAWRGPAALPSAGPGTGPWSSPPKLHERLPPQSN